MIRRDRMAGGASELFDLMTPSKFKCIRPFRYRSGEILLSKRDLEILLRDEFLRATRECQTLGYNPTGFMRLLSDRGTIERLYMGSYEGFERLWRLGRLDLSVEAIIRREPYRTLFAPEVLDRAEQKLRDVGYFK